MRGTFGLAAGAVLVAVLPLSAADAGESEKCPVSANVRGHENTEWSRAYAYHLADGRMSNPRVLLVGDSIVADYEGEVRRALDRENVNVSYWISSYCVTSPRYRAFLDIYLSEAKYDVVHFNNGLHSLGTDTRQWAAALEKALRLVRKRQPGARIVWCTSTPLKSEGKTAKVRELNAAAAEVVARMGGVETDDLFALLDPLDRKAHWRDEFHHKPNVSKMEGGRVAKAVLAALERGKAPSAATGK